MAVKVFSYVATVLHPGKDMSITDGNHSVPLSRLPSFSLIFHRHLFKTQPFALTFPPVPLSI
jgi:hypothetical protein